MLGHPAAVQSHGVPGLEGGLQGYGAVLAALGWRVCARAALGAALAYQEEGLRSLDLVQESQPSATASTPTRGTDSADLPPPLDLAPAGEPFLTANAATGEGEPAAPPPPLHLSPAGQPLLAGQPDADAPSDCPSENPWDHASEDPGFNLDDILASRRPLPLMDLLRWLRHETDRLEEAIASSEAEPGAEGSVHPEEQLRVFVSEVDPLVDPIWGHFAAEALRAGFVVLSEHSGRGFEDYWTTYLVFSLAHRPGARQAFARFRRGEQAPELPELEGLRRFAVPLVLAYRDPIEARREACLDSINVSYPCPTPRVTPQDGRVQRCESCQLDVLDIRGLARAEADELIRATLGRCLSLFRRADGKIQAADCPRGRLQPEEKEDAWPEELDLL
jgi:hypothetical protein